MHKAASVPVPALLSNLSLIFLSQRQVRAYLTPWQLPSAFKGWSALPSPVCSRWRYSGASPASNWRLTGSRGNAR